MIEIYNTLSIFVTSGLFLAFGLMFLFIPLPDSPLLGNYRRARHAMAGAYLFFVVVEIAKGVQSILTDVHSVPLLQTVTLTIAVSQAFLYTYAIVALLETRFPGWRYVLRDAIPAAGLIVAIFCVYAFCSEACFRTLFFGFWGLYALLLVRYTWLFTQIHRQFRRRMDNFFSGNEADRMRWIAFSFYAALAIGIGALITSVFMSTPVALGFTVIFDVFYTFFAIRFIGYAARFSTIEEAMEDPVIEDAVQPESEKPMVGNGKPALSINFDALEQRIEQWVADKGYTEPGITINTLYPRLSTNRHYLSTYINTCKGKTFREWINELRIAEACRLLTEHPEMTVGEITSRMGFATKSHFGQQFQTIVHSSPSAWREQQKMALNNPK